MAGGPGLPTTRADARTRGRHFFDERQVLRKRNWLLCPLGAGLVFHGCKPAANHGSGTEAVVESAAWYAPKVETSGAAALSTDRNALPELLDVRGVGDTAGDVSGLGQVPAYWKGDLAFVNWESVVSNSCERQNPGVDFFFRSTPQHIRGAHALGFNLFGVANELPLVWAGTAAVEESEGSPESNKPYVAHVKSFNVKGKILRVALGALTIQSWHMNGVAEIATSRENASKENVKAPLRSLQSAEADFRVLSIHTQDGSGNNRQEDTSVLYARQVAEDFIKSYNGNLVFGHGPHTQAGVKVVVHNDERKGIIFTSLGNFMHPGLAAHADNDVGRAVFDFTSKSLKFVQTFPVRNSGGGVQFLTTGEARKPMSNFDWKSGSQSCYASF